VAASSLVAVERCGSAAAFCSLFHSFVLFSSFSTAASRMLVAIAAILVASIRLHFLEIVLNSATRGPSVFPCHVNVSKGDELGWFEHGSTFIVLAPEHFEFCGNVVESARIRAGNR
jgi:phosphatidylserine decarboxylase